VIVFGDRCTCFVTKWICGVIRYVGLVVLVNVLQLPEYLDSKMGTVCVGSRIGHDDYDGWII